MVCPLPFFKLWTRLWNAGLMQTSLAQDRLAQTRLAPAGLLGFDPAQIAAPAKPLKSGYRDHHRRSAVLPAGRAGGDRFGPVERRLCRRRPDGDADAGANHATP